MQHESYLYPCSSIQAVIRSLIVPLLLLADENIYPIHSVGGLNCVYEVITEQFLYSNWSKRCEKRLLTLSPSKSPP